MNATTIRDDFGEAISPHHGALLRTALGLTHDLSEARDLVQDSLERALRQWSRFTPGTNIRAWVTAILSRLFIDRWRKGRRQPRFVSLDAVDPPAIEIDPWTEPRSWEALTESDIKQAAAGLPPRFRRVFELSAFGHLSYAEISAMTGIPASTVGTRLLRARRRLQEMLARMAKPEARSESLRWDAAGLPLSRGLPAAAQKSAAA